jgi:hypothetical protein
MASTIARSAEQEAIWSGRRHFSPRQNDVTCEPRQSREKQAESGPLELRGERSGTAVRRGHAIPPTRAGGRAILRSRKTKTRRGTVRALSGSVRCVAGGARTRSSAVHRDRRRAERADEAHRSVGPHVVSRETRGRARIRTAGGRAVHLGLFVRGRRVTTGEHRCDSQHDGEHRDTRRPRVPRLPHAETFTEYRCGSARSAEGSRTTPASACRARGLAR